MVINVLSKVSPNFSFINGSIIDIMGSFTIKLIFQVLPNSSLDINLHVINNDSLPMDLIIGRDFLDAHKIKVIYNLGIKDASKKITLFKHVAFAEKLDNSQLSLLT